MDDVARLAAALGDDLGVADFTVEAVADLLGPVALGALDREQVAPAAAALRGRRDPLAVLTSTLLLGRPATRAALAAAVPVLGVDGLVALGLVESAGAGDDDAVRPLLEVSPFAAVDEDGTSRWWVVSDHGEAVTRGPLPAEHVIGVGAASSSLARATPRSPGARVLDLGTGSGVQALHASRWAGSVVATDVSHRALRLARIGLLASGVGPETVELRHGSLLDPVRDEEFDLVVSNPPFVITPRATGVPRYPYRDGGRAGDDLVRELVGTLGDVLLPGGVAVLLGNWEVGRGQAWSDRVGTWVDASGLDAVVVQRELLDPAEYAELWVRDGGTRPGPDFDALLLAWLADLASRDVEAVGLGLLVLRRPVAGAPGLRRLEERTGPAAPGLGDHLAGTLRAHDLLTSLADDDLLDRRWTVATDVTEERHHRPGEADPSVIVLRSTAGFGAAQQVSTVTAAVVGACDGDLTLGQIVGAVAVLLEREVAAVRAEVLPVVRGLVGDQVLLPA